MGIADPYGSRGSTRRPHLKSFILVLLILEVATIALYAVLFYNFGQNMNLSENGAQAAAAQSADGQDAEDPNALKTAKVATLGDLSIRSTVAPKDMTGVLFHQASYSGLNPVKTKLPTANATKALKKHSLKVNADQSNLKGWADAEALHLYRQGNTQPMNTAIDIGGKAGCNVYAPVTGTVTLVKKYKLYGKTKDYRIHIQPDGHPEYDVVVLHSKKPCVKAGDHVEAGITRIATMRKISSSLNGIQLGDYTKEGGNHSHIQIGNANDSSYRKRVLKGAKFPEASTQ